MTTPRRTRILAPLVLAAALAATAPALAAFIPTGMTRETDIALPGSATCRGEVAFDAATGYLYVATQEDPGKIHKIRAATDSQPAAVVSSLTLESGEDAPSALVVDSINRVLYVASGDGLTPYVIKFDLGEGDAPLTRLGKLPIDIDFLWHASLDQVNGHLYVASGGDPGAVVKIKVGAPADPMTTAGILTLPPGDTYNYHVAVDPARGIGWTVCYGNPNSTLAQFQLGAGDAAPTFVSSTPIPTEADGLFEATCDPRNQTIYAGSYDGGGVYKADVSGPVPVNRAYLPIGGNAVTWSSIAIDPDNGFGIGGGETPTASLYLFTAGSRFEGPGLLATLPLPGEATYHSAVIDPKNRRAYLPSSVTANLLVVKLTGEPGSGVDLGGTFPKTSAKTKGASTTVKAQAAITNAGTADSGFFLVRSFLSRDPILDPSDTPIGKDRIVKNLKAGKSRKAPVSAKLPALAPGRYFVITVADPQDLTNDENRADNVIVSPPIDL